MDGWCWIQSDRDILSHLYPLVNALYTLFKNRILSYRLRYSPVKIPICPLPVKKSKIDIHFGILTGVEG